MLIIDVWALELVGDEGEPPIRYAWTRRQDRPRDDRQPKSMLRIPFNSEIMSGSHNGDPGTLIAASHANRGLS